MEEVIKMKFEKIFEPKLIIRLMKECIEFLAEKELLVDIYIKRGIDKRYLQQANFEFIDNKIYIKGLPFSMQNVPWRAIEIGNRCFWFENAKLDKFKFDNRNELEEEIQHVFNILSKNKKNELEKLLHKLCDKLTVKRMLDFFTFLDKHLNIKYSTVYGFDGGSVRIINIYPYNSEGKKKFEIKKEIKNNLEEIKEMERKISTLKQYNKQNIEKLKIIKD
jgi:hypothetical protein